MIKLDSVWQEFEKLQPEEGQNAAGFEPGLYSPRSKEVASDGGKGLIRSASTNPGPRPTARSVPDPELTPEDDLNDAILPPTSSSSSSRTTIPTQPLASSRSTSRTASPVSALGSTLGPATAATAALGQKAVGMFSNVSSFFQAKKKELVEAQREAEEQYQQRIHQHERKKKIMQERARATASTFAISTSPRPAKPNQAVPEVYAYVAPQSPRSPTNSVKGAAEKSPSLSAVSAKAVDAEEEEKKKEDIVVGSDTGSVPIVSPIPVTPIVVSPTLTRGSGGDRMFDEAAGTDVGQESQDEIEKELQEALDESNEMAGPTKAQLSTTNSSLSNSDSTVPTTSLSIEAPTRSLTPAECYSPFSEISAPSSPVKSDAKPLEAPAAEPDQEAAAMKDQQPEPVS